MLCQFILKIKKTHTRLKKYKPFNEMLTIFSVVHLKLYSHDQEKNCRSDISFLFVP